MKIRITGTCNKDKSNFVSRSFDLSDPFWMDLAVQCWKENAKKFDKLDIIDAETGEESVADPDIERFSNKVAGIKSKE